MAEADDMAGLTNCRAEFGPYEPLKGARITIFYSHITPQTFHFTQTLIHLGSQLRFCSANIDDGADMCYQDDAASSTLSWKDESRYEYWRCIERALDWGPDGGPHLIVDHGGDASLVIHEGVRAEDIYAKTGQLPDPSSAVNSELEIVLNIIRDGLETHPMRFHHMKEGIVGVTVEANTGVDRLLQMQANEALLFPAINVHHSVTKGKYSNLYGSRYALLDGIQRATNVTISGKRAVVCGHDHEGSQGCAIALKQAGADVAVYEVDPNREVQARLGGFSVIKTLDGTVSEADIFVTNFNKQGNNNIDDVFNHVKKMKNNAIIYITDPISLDRINLIYATHKLYFPGMTRIILDPQTDKWVSYETNSSIMVLWNKGFPNLMSSWSCTSHVVAMLELWSKRGTGKYEDKVYDLPEHLEEKVSALHLAKLTMKTTKKDARRQGGDDDHVFLAKKSDSEMILLMVAQACWFFGMVALGVIKGGEKGI